MKCNIDRKNILLFIAVITAIFVLGSADVSFSSDSSEAYEDAQVLEAGKILSPDVLSGPNHKVEEKVQNDGFLNHYVLRSSYGDMTWYRLMY